ncbi:hypothetical protein ACFL5U_03415, partial [Candidatus Margulisiibacteriota bacterium]
MPPNIHRSTLAGNRCYPDSLALLKRPPLFLKTLGGTYLTIPEGGKPFLFSMPVTFNVRGLPMPGTNVRDVKLEIQPKFANYKDMPTIRMSYKAVNILRLVLT